MEPTQLTDGSSHRQKKHTKGLVLGTVALFLFVVVLFVLALGVRGLVHHRRLVSLMDNGRNMNLVVQSAFHWRLPPPEWPPGDTGAWPQGGSTDPLTGTFETSTDYFRWMVTSGVANVDLDFFGGPSLADAEGLTPEHFTAEHNAWCIVADVDQDYPDNAPVLFTRNVQANNITDLRGMIRGTLSHAPPFGQDGVVIVFKGTGCLILSHEERTWESTIAYQGLTNRILRP